MRLFILSLIFLSSAASFALEAFQIDCEPATIRNRATIEGLVILDTQEDGEVIVRALLDEVTLVYRGHAEKTLSFDGMAFETVLTQRPGLTNAQGEPQTWRAIKVARPADGIEYMVLSLDLPGFQSWIRTSDQAKFFAKCKLSPRQVLR